MNINLAIPVLFALTVACAAAEDPVMSTAQEEAVHVARAELSSALGVAITEIELKQVESVDWPNSSLGCPKKGVMYLDVITPGYRVDFSVSGRTYRIHTAEQRAILCKKGIKPLHPHSPSAASSDRGPSDH